MSLCARGSLISSPQHRAPKWEPPPCRVPPVFGICLPGMPGVQLGGTGWTECSLKRPWGKPTLVWVEDSEEFRATDQDHLTHVGRLPTRDVVPHPRAPCGDENHGERASSSPSPHTHTEHTHSQSTHTQSTHSTHRAYTHRAHTLTEHTHTTHTHRAYTQSVYTEHTHTEHTQSTHTQHTHTELLTRQTLLHHIPSPLDTPSPVATWVLLSPFQEGSISSVSSSPLSELSAALSFLFWVP